jgi:hypothetical protein
MEGLELEFSSNAFNPAMKELISSFNLKKLFNIGYFDVDNICSIFSFL